MVRWTAAGMINAERSFRRVKGYKQMPQLVAALYRTVLCGNIDYQHGKWFNKSLGIGLNFRKGNPFKNPRLGFYGGASIGWSTAEYRQRADTQGRVCGFYYGGGCYSGGRRRGGGGRYHVVTVGVGMGFSGSWKFD